MADYKQSFEVLDSWEGGYSLNHLDPGGETYCGISRRNWPNWTGWSVIDRIKNERSTLIPVNNRGIKWNEKFPELDSQVSGFYLSAFWMKQSFSSLDNQDICDKIFQHYVNMGVRAIKLVQQSTNDELYSRTATSDFLVVDGQMGQKTVDRINSINNQELINRYCDTLKEYYEGLIAEHPQFEVFEHEWMLRAKTIGKRPI
jgi:lysozyme family protein